ncbi:20098_t:CDS:2, partial [Dentiscutata erythropus]
NNNPSTLFENGSNSSLFEDNDNFNTSSSLLTENNNNLIDRFMYNYCLEQGFGYQVFHNDKDLNDPSIIYHKSFRCLSSSTYEPRK